MAKYKCGKCGATFVHGKRAASHRARCRKGGSLISLNRKRKNYEERGTVDEAGRTKVTKK